MLKKFTISPSLVTATENAITITIFAIQVASTFYKFWGDHTEFPNEALLFVSKTSLKKPMSSLLPGTPSSLSFTLRGRPVFFMKKKPRSYTLETFIRVSVPILSIMDGPKASRTLWNVSWSSKFRRVSSISFTTLLGAWSFVTETTRLEFLL